MRPPSRCPHCGHAVRWRHNVPVLGWIWLRGRCFDCGHPISPRYPAMEAAFGAAAGLSIWHLGASALAWQFTGFFLALLLIAWVDWETLHIYDVCTLPLGLAGLTLSPRYPALYGAWWTSAASAGATLALMWGLGLAGEKLYKRDAMGGGDVKLMAAAAGWLGWLGTAQALVWGILLGLPLMLAYQRLHRLHWRQPAPFGPGLCAGCLLAGWDLLTGEPSRWLAGAGLGWLTLSTP